MKSICFTNSINSIGADVARPAVLPAAGSQNTTVVPAKFLDIYRSSIAAAVDKNGDGEISIEELTDQIRHAGSAGDDASAQLNALDVNGDRKVSVDEFAHSVSNPLENNHDALLRKIIDETAAGQRGVRPEGYVLNGSGRVADPEGVLRYLAGLFPGNVNE